MTQVRVFNAWTRADDAMLSQHHGSAPLSEIAAMMGRSRSSLRARITRLGLSKQEYWTPDEEAALRNLYSAAGNDGVLKLSEFSKSIGRDKANVCRKAKSLGLTTNKSRKIVEARKVRRKFSSKEELRAAISIRAKERIRVNGHPRGFLGGKHSDKARQAIAAKTKARWQGMSDDERASHILKSVRGRVLSDSQGHTSVKRGSWKAGWREIGGKRNYYRSMWEANYARYLQWLKDRGDISDWQHEPEVFWFDGVKRGVVSYKPDFRVWENDGTSKLHEVKGWMDARSKTCLRRMKKYHPKETIILVVQKDYQAIKKMFDRIIMGWEMSDRDNRL